jgi:poly(3-hydroxybutyrate) depolymerase
MTFRRAMGIALASSVAALAACTTNTTIIKEGPGGGGDGGGGGGSDGDGGGVNNGSDGGGTTGSDAGGGNGSDGGTTMTGPCKYMANKTGLNAFQQAGGLAFHVYAPSSYDANVAHTVVVIMHGQDSDGTAELTALWQPIADANQLVLLAPKGSRPSTDPTNYPNGANWAVADLNNIQDLITDIDACYNVEPKKHILWGFSEGCFYGYLLGIGASTQFSGLAMGGANTSFARQNGYDPSMIGWKIPVSHVQGTMDPNGTAQSIQDQKDFQAAGSVFTLYQPVQGHTITPAQVQQQYDDLKSSSSP